MTTQYSLIPDPIYTTYAQVYDRSGQMRFAIIMGMYLKEVLERHQPPTQSMLDLACGTGTLALHMAELGWQVIAVDASPAMLDEAGQKQARAGTSVQFQAGDMRSFAVPEPVALVTCCYDSLNYLLTDDDLRSCFRAVAAALAPGGLFCFDLATDHFLREYWRGVEEHHGEDYDYTIVSSFDETSRRSTLTLEGVVEDDEGQERTLREVHVERAHEPALVEQLLGEVGLAPEAVYDCFTFQPPEERSLRHFWVVRKP